MNIKAYLENGSFILINVLTAGDIKDISNKFNKWEYVL